MDLTKLRDFLLAPEPDYGESAAATIATAAVAAAASFGMASDGGGSGNAGNDGNGGGFGGSGGADGGLGGTNMTDLAAAIGELLGDSPLAISRYQRLPSFLDIVAVKGGVMSVRVPTVRVGKIIMWQKFSKKSCLHAWG